jgi:hypothetical protein
MGHEVPPFAGGRPRAAPAIPCGGAIVPTWPAVADPWAGHHRAALLLACGALVVALLLRVGPDQRVAVNPNCFVFWGQFLA